MYTGLGLAFLGSAIAVGLACSGSAKGVGIVGEVGSNLLSEQPERFSSVLIYQIIPGTQGLYGLVAWFFALMKLGFFSGQLVQLDFGQGLMFFAACLPIGICGFISAFAQGKCTAASIHMIAKRPDQLSKGIIMAIMVEFYAILSLLATFLMLNSLDTLLGL